MKPEFPHKMQYAMNLSNKSSEAVDRINKWVNDNGGSVEHKSHEAIQKEMSQILKK